MSPEINLKIQLAVRWILIIAFTAAGLGAINEGIVDYKVMKFAENAKEVPLSSVLKNKPDGKWIKLSDYEIDIRKRLRALPDKSSTDDLHILVPLRVPGEYSDAPIRFLFRMQEDSNNPISDAYDAYQDSGAIVLDGAAFFVEIVPIEDLPGNVPNVVRNDERIAKNAVVFYYLPIRKSIEINFFIGGVMFVIAFFLYWRIRKTRINSTPKFS